jgi:type II secretion system protein H
MQRRRNRGFTLVELMTVVTIIGVVASIAVVSWRKTTTENDVNRWAQQLRTAVSMGNRRALSTGTPYLLLVQSKSVQWCQVDPATITGPPWATTQTACSSLPAGVEVGPITGAPSDAQVSLYLNSADLVQPNGSYTTPATTAIGSGTHFFFGKNGTAGNTLASVTASAAPPPGFTIYVRRGIGADEVQKHRRVVVYGASSKARIIDNY